MFGMHPASLKKAAGRPCVPRIVLVLVAVVASGLAISISGNAFEPQSPVTLTAGSASGTPGSNLELSISLMPGAASVCTLQFDLQFSTAMTYVSTTTGSAAAAAQKTANANVISGGVRILVFAMNRNTIGAGPVAVVRLAIAPGTPAGSIPVSLANVAVSDPDGIGIPFTSVNGSITVLPPADIIPPVLSAITSSGITSTGATISWTTNEAADSQVDYGTTTSYGSSTSLNSIPVTSHSQALTGLSPSTLYHYRVKSKDAAGNLSVSGDSTLTTTASQGTNPPKIDNIALPTLTSKSATITWRTDVPADSQVFFGTAPDCGLATKLITPLTISHSQKIGGLRSSTTYYYRVQSRSAAGILGVSGTNTFQTPSSRGTKLVYARLFSKSGTKTGMQSSPYTGFAIANLGSEEAAVTFTAYNSMGAKIAGHKITNPVERILPPNGQLPIMDMQLFGSNFTDNDTFGWLEVVSNSDTVTGFSLIFDASLSMMDGSPIVDNPLSQFVFTEIEDQGYTDLHVANANSDPATIRFQIMQSNGTIRSQALRMIPPYGGMAESISSLFPGIILESSDYLRAISDVQVVPFELLGKTSQYLAALNGQDLGSAASTLYAPQYVVGGGYRSTLSITNLDPVEGHLTLRLVGDDGAQIGETKVMPIAGEGKAYISDQSFFGVPGDEPLQGYVEIMSSGPRVVGNVFMGDSDRSTFATALPLASHLDDSLIFGHIASDQTYFTGLALLNPGEGDATTTVDLYKADGSLDDSITVIIPGRHRISKLLTELFPSLVGQGRISGYIHVYAEKGIAGYSVFGTHDLSTLSAVPAQIQR
jgi:hypothetical protein